MSLKVDFRIILEAIVQCMVAVEKASRPPVRSSTGAVVQVQLGILPSKIIEIYNQQIARLSQLKSAITRTLADQHKGECLAQVEIIIQELQKAVQRYYALKELHGDIPLVNIGEKQEYIKELNRLYKHLLKLNDYFSNNN